MIAQGRTLSSKITNIEVKSNMLDKIERMFNKTFEAYPLRINIGGLSHKTIFTNEHACSYWKSYQAE